MNQESRELRCNTKLFGILKNGLIEIKCTSRFCGADKFTLVFHYFDPETFALVETKKFRNPER